MVLLHGGAITPEIKSYCAIRWLAGASYSDIQYKVGILKASFYRIVWATIRIINQCENLEIKFPQTNAQCLELAEGFRPLNEKGAIKGCVGAMDGWLLKIFTPPKNAVGNVCSFFSGHYQCYGLNIQAVCNHHCHFLYIAIVGPGVMNDNQAYKEKVDGVSLSDLIEHLPRGFYIIGCRCCLHSDGACDSLCWWNQCTQANIWFFELCCESMLHSDWNGLWASIQEMGNFLETL